MADDDFDDDEFDDLEDLDEDEEEEEEEASEGDDGNRRGGGGRRPARRRSLRPRNPTIDRKVSLSDEQYASGFWYRFGHEATTFGPTADSRVVDTQTERDDQAGVLFYVPVYFEELAPHVVEVPDEAAKDWQPKRNPLTGAIKFVRFVWRLVHGQKERPESEYDFQFRLMLAGHFGKELDQVDKDEIKKFYREQSDKAEEFHKQIMEMPGIIRKVRRWVLTPMSIDALPQAPHRPFFMIPNWLLDLFYEKELAKKQAVLGVPDDHFWYGDDDKYWVDYVYTGCVVWDDDPAVLEDVNEELVTFIRTYDPRSGEVPPFPLRVVEGKFRIPRKYEDQRSITMRVHKYCSQMVQTAAQVYLMEKHTKKRTSYYHDHKFPLPAYVTEAEAPGEELSDEGAYAYISKQVSAGKWSKNIGQKKARELRKYYENWQENNYDRFYPNECYDYRENFFDSLSFYHDWASKADRIWEFMQLQLHVIQYPEVVSHDKREVNWAPFKAYVGRVEDRRHVIRLYNHWKMGKSMGNTRDAGDIEAGDIKNARRNDWGGPWTGLKNFILDWRYRKLREEANRNPAAADRLLGPVWGKKRPWQRMDHDGSLITRFAEKWKNFVDGLKIIRLLSSKAGLGQFPRWDKLSEKELIDVRSYRSEYYWLLHDEYATRDPIDAWNNQNGIVSYSLIDEANIRLEGPYRDVPQVRLYPEACTNFKQVLTLMWYYQPVAPLEENLVHDLAEAEADHEEETLGDLAKSLKGLPGKVVPHIQVVDEFGQLVWTTDTAGNRVPVYYPGREDMERMIERLRRRAIFWMLDRIPEKIFPGHMRHWTEAGKWIAMGWPWRMGDDEESIRLFQAALTQVWHCKVYDILNGKANVQDTPDTLWNLTDNIKWMENKMNGGGLNPHYAAGYEPERGGQVWSVRQQEVAEYLGLWVQFPCPTDDEHQNRTGFTYEVATMILDKNDWAEVEVKLRDAGYSYDQVRRVWGVYSTYQHRPVLIN